MNISFENPDKVSGLLTLVVEEADIKKDVNKTIDNNSPTFHLLHICGDYMHVSHEFLPNPAVFHLSTQPRYLSSAAPVTPPH